MALYWPWISGNSSPIAPNDSISNERQHCFKSLVVVPHSVAVDLEEVDDPVDSDGVTVELSQSHQGKVDSVVLGLEKYVEVPSSVGQDTFSSVADSESVIDRMSLEICKGFFIELKGPGTIWSPEQPTQMANMPSSFEMEMSAVPSLSTTTEEAQESIILQ